MYIPWRSSAIWDRSTMYKFINGKRRPSSISLVRKMADFMLLTPAEYQLLSEAYRISLVGPEIYFRRKYIWKFLQNPGKYISALPVNFTKTGAHSKPPPPCRNDRAGRTISNYKLYV